MMFISYYILIIILRVHGLPTKQAKEDVNCLILSPEVQDQINDITNKISTFITDISKKYDNIDLRLINMNIDRHSAFETNKSTEFRVNINDCATKETYTKYTNNSKNNSNKRKDAGDDINNGGEPVQDDSIDFDDLDDDEDLKFKAPISDEYVFAGNTSFISGDEDNVHVMNYKKNENNNVTDEHNYGKFIYYFNFNDISNKNVTCEKVNVFE